MIRFGMCGVGGFIERAILPVMQKLENVQAVAAFDVNLERVDNISRKFDIGQPCATFQELIKSDGVDAVYIASPNVLHKEQTIAAARAGKHVFCQKPLGMNAQECREMVNACRESGVKLGVGFCYRFQGAQQRVLELIREGSIGELSYIYLSFNLSSYNPETVGWRCDPKMSGGGPLMDLAPHMIDLASFFLDDRAVSAMAYVHPERTSAEIETDVLAIMEFGRGSRVSLDTSFVRGNGVSYTVVGNRGQIRALDTMPWLTHGKMVGTLTLEVRGKEQHVSFSGCEHIEEELRVYCNAVENAEDPPVSGEIGLYVQAVIDTIYESGRTGRRCCVTY